MRRFVAKLLKERETIMENLTCKTPAPSTRTEAWTAWEAAVLELTGRNVSRERPHLKKFWRKFNSKKWELFALEIYPNRNEVSVKTLDGRIVKVAVIIGVGVNEPPFVTQYRVNREKYPEFAERQDKMIATGAMEAGLLTKVNEPLVKRVCYKEYGMYYTYSLRYYNAPTIYELLENGSIVSCKVDPEAVYWIPAEPEYLDDTRKVHCQDKDLLIQKLKDGL